MRRWILFAILISLADAFTTWVALRNGAFEANPVARGLFAGIGFWTVCAIGVALNAAGGALAGWAPQKSVYRFLPVLGRAVLCLHAGVVMSNLFVIMNLLGK